MGIAILIRKQRPTWAMISTESEENHDHENNVNVKVQPPPSVSTVRKGRRKVHWNMGRLLGFCMLSKNSRFSFSIVRKVLAPFIFSAKKILAPSHFLSEKSLPDLQFSLSLCFLLFSIVFFCLSLFYTPLPL